MIVVGVDPSSQDKGHGVAIYNLGVLLDLKMMSTVDIVLFVTDQEKGNIFFSIEDVASQNFTYSSHGSNQRHLGKCQQAQVELTRWLDYLTVKYNLHKPTKHNWHNNKRLFENMTGWEGKSNDDTRSAAYFGYINKDIYS